MTKIKIRAVKDLKDNTVRFHGSYHITFKSESAKSSSYVLVPLFFYTNNLDPTRLVSTPRM